MPEMSMNSRLQTYGELAEWSTHDMVPVHELPADGDLSKQSLYGQSWPEAFDCYVGFAVGLGLVCFYRPPADSGVSLEKGEPGESERDFTIYVRTESPLTQSTVDRALSELVQILKPIGEEIRRMEPGSQRELLTQDLLGES